MINTTEKEEWANSLQKQYQELKKLFDALELDLNRNLFRQNQSAGNRTKRQLRELKNSISALKKSIVQYNKNKTDENTKFCLRCQKLKPVSAFRPHGWACPSCKKR